MSNLKLATQISEGFLQQLRNFLDQRADVINGNDPYMPYEPNAALELLHLLDAETDGEFQ